MWTCFQAIALQDKGRHHYCHLNFRERCWEIVVVV